MTSQEPPAIPDPAERLEELIEGFQVTQAVYVAAKLTLLTLCAMDRSPPQNLPHPWAHMRPPCSD
jgi:hypothetical protein